MLIAMDQMDRYIARNVLAAIVVVQFVLLGLDITIAYIGDLGDTQGDYSAQKLSVLHHADLALRRSAHHLLTLRSGCQSRHLSPDSPFLLA